MISTKTIKVIRCDVPGCPHGFAVETDRDAVVLTKACAKNWTKRKGQYGNMEDRCPQHANWKAGE